MTNRLIQGEVQNIRKDSKAIQINNEWFSGFKVLRFNKGDNIEIEYFVNDKGFNQIYSSKLLPKEVKLDNVTTSNELTNTDKDCILLCAKDIYLDNKDIPLNELVKEIKRLRLSI